MEKDLLILFIIIYTMIPKTKGAEDKCPSCGQTLVCREVEYKGNVKLQWQYKDKEEAHFSFDFATKKSACKEQTPSKASTTSADQLNISGLVLDKKIQESIMGAAEDRTERMLVVLSTVQRKCREAGIEHPATIGMVFNQVCEIGRE